MGKDNQIVSFHKPDEDGVIELRGTPKNHIPKGYDYIILFQKTLENVLTYDLSKSEIKTFVFILSQTGFDNNLVMPGLQSLCSKRIKTNQAHISRALKKLRDLNIIVREKIEDTKSYRYRINYALCAKTNGENIKSFVRADEKDNPIKNQMEMF